jgi:hypothetical protein
MDESAAEAKSYLSSLSSISAVLSKGAIAPLGLSIKITFQKLASDSVNLGLTHDFPYFR